MLHLHFSNRLPHLTARLLRELAQRPRGVFEVDEVLVPSKAMERSLQLAVADTHGICANLGFDNLARWLWRMVGRVVPEMEGHSPFQPDTLTWQVLAVLSDPAFVAPHPRLESYLRAADPVMHYDLAVRIAGLFDQYITFRSDWLERWSDGEAAVPVLPGHGAEDVVWQSELWRRLLVRLSAEDRHPRQRFIEALKDPVKAALLPPAVHLYALPSIPPLYIEWLQALEPYLEIHLYVLNPCAEYWAEIVSPRRLSRLQARGEAGGHEVGNPLLAAWAGPTRAYFAALVDAFGNRAVEDEAAFQASEAGTVLAQVQNRILHLEDLAPGALRLEATDRSLEIHVCHSLTRQLEVVIDRLLGLFSLDADPAARLRPADVLVAVPDLETASPLVDAVFSALPESRRIPYVITGRPRRQSDSAARALCDLLAFASSRLEADGCFALLSQPLIARRFGLEAERLDTLRHWICASGYRFGLDADHRKRLSLPPEARNTLTDGMDRLFLAYALPEGQTEPILNDLLPALGVTDPSTEDLSALATFAVALQDLVKSTAQPLRAEQWSTLLDALLDRFLLPERSGNDLEELEQTRASVRAVCEAMHRADPSAAHEMSVLRAALEAALEDPVRGGVASGAVTVASIASLRGLPFRVICLLGLDDGVFPRVDRPADFDLMAREPRLGDRQRRSDDRNVFLDHLLSARDVLHLSYTGFSDRTNAPLPPSAVVSELLEAILPATVSADLAGDAQQEALKFSRRQMVLEHPLQPFAPEYFLGADPRLQSFNTELAEALRRQLAGTGEPAEAAEAPVEADSEEEDDDRVVPPRPLFFTQALTSAALPATLPVEDLRRFLRGPAAYLLERQLQITLGRSVDELPVAESLLPDRSRDEQLRSRLYTLARSGTSREALLRFVHASPEAPPGALGQTVADRWVGEAVAFAAAAERCAKGATLPTHEVSLPVQVGESVCVLTGAWADLRESGRVEVSFRHSSPSALLPTWVDHVVLNCAPPAGMPRVTTHLFTDEQVTFAPLLDPMGVLTDLLQAYAEGLTQPLPLYPKSSLEYVEKPAGDAAHKKFYGSEYSTSTAEGDYPSVKLAMRGVADPLGDRFKSVSQQLLAPMLASLTRSTP